MHFCQEWHLALYKLSDFLGIRNLSGLNDLNNLNSLSDLYSLISSKTYFSIKIETKITYTGLFLALFLLEAGEGAQRQK